MTPKVSIIVPNYNHAPFLEQRIESILGQTFQDYELVLLDDCSDDASRDIIHAYKNKYPFIRVFINGQNSGNPCRQWDFGVIKTEGEYVWIAESDDDADRNFLTEMVPVLEQNKNVGFAYCDARVIDSLNNPISLMSDNYLSRDKRRKKDYVNKGKDEIARCLSIANMINNVSGVLFRRSSYINAGYADHALRYCGDWFLYLRILLTTDIGYKAIPLNSFRFHDRSSFHRYYADDLYLKEVLWIYKFIIGTISLPTFSRKRINKEIAGHFCSSIRKGFIPSKQVIFSMREIIPRLELCTLNFIMVYIIKKYIWGSLPNGNHHSNSKPKAL